MLKLTSSSKSGLLRKYIAVNIYVKKKEEKFQVNDPNFYLKTMEKQEKTKAKISIGSKYYKLGQKLIKQRLEKSRRKLIKPKVASLRRLTKLTKFWLDNKKREKTQMVKTKNETVIIIINLLEIKKITRV